MKRIYSYSKAVCIYTDIPN